MITLQEVLDAHSEPLTQECEDALGGLIVARWDGEQAAIPAYEIENLPGGPSMGQIAQHAGKDWSTSHEALDDLYPRKMRLVFRPVGKK